MSERKKHKMMIGIEVVLLCMIIATLRTNAASSNPPSNGVSYGKNSQTTVEGALNDLYNKANYGNASAGDILSGKTALVGGKKVTGTMPNNLSGTASSVVTYENSLYYRIPAGYYGGLGWGSEISATYADVASAIGLTEGKLLKGETVLGVTGTGTTGYSSCSSCCPTLASQTSSATAGAGDILKDKTAYVNGSKITGSMTNQGAVSGTISPGGTYTIPAGYHNGSGKVMASACPTCGTGINDDNTNRFSGKMINGITSTIGDYYMIAYNIGFRNVPTDTFTGCTIIVNDTHSVEISGTKYYTRSLICKATADKITVSGGEQARGNWTWYKLN